MKSYSQTDIGCLRRMNQDSVYCSEEPVGNLSNLFIVADGMGGHRAGNRASELAIQKMVWSIQNNKEENPLRILTDAIREANLAVFFESIEREACRGMGTTLVAATISGKGLVVVNVGDSRLYLIHRNADFEGKRITQITVDHSMVEEMVLRGKLTPEEARFHPDKNVITRAVGTQSDVEGDLFEVSLEEEDRILLCSDGLTNMVSDETIYQIISEQNDVERAGECLVNLANQNGGHDNISVILIDNGTGGETSC